MIEIKEITSKSDIVKFIKFPLFLYKDYPLYTPQITMDLKTDFNKDKNPFFKHSKVKFYLAYKQGNCVGRIVSIVNDLHLEHHNDGVGFFGFFEVINDQDAANALLGRVSADLKAHGLKVMRGPMNFSVNEECGLLIDAFDLPPILMTPYNPPYYQDLITKYGMEKAKDLYAYIVKVPDELPEKALRVAALAEKRGLTARHLNKKDFKNELEKFKKVYNSAWEKNWGFIPLTNDELDYLGNKLKMIVVPDMTAIAEKDGEPIGFLGLFPDFNVVLRQMHGSLNPLTLAKALYYEKKVKDGRLMILGIKEGYRRKGVDALLYREAFKGVKRLKYENVEFSWILEDNTPVQMSIKMIGGRHYKTYRVYDKAV
jgi:hypothetical protein